jgi:hypothetical protein
MMPDGARVLAAVVVTLGVGGVAGGVSVWLLRLAALAAGSHPDAGTTGMFVAVMTFVGGLLPGAVATALGRRRTGRVLLAAGSVGVAIVGSLAQDWHRLADLSAGALGLTLLLDATLLAVVVGAAAATEWLTAAAVRPVDRG